MAILCFKDKHLRFYSILERTVLYYPYFSHRLTVSLAPTCSALSGKCWMPIVCQPWTLSVVTCSRSSFVSPPRVRTQNSYLLFHKTLFATCTVWTLLTKECLDFPANQRMPWFPYCEFEYYGYFRAYSQLDFFTFKIFIHIYSPLHKH